MYLFASPCPPVQKLVLDKSSKDVEGLGGVAGIAALLRSDLNRGLSTGDGVPAARAAFGENRLPPKPRKWWLAHFKESITDLTLMILMAGATLSIIFSQTIGGRE